MHLNTLKLRASLGIVKASLVTLIIFSRLYKMKSQHSSSSVNLGYICLTLHKSLINIFIYITTI